MSFDGAWRLRTPPNPKTHSWDFRLYADGTAPVMQGDTMLATFWMRAISVTRGQGLAGFVVERSSNPWTKSAQWIATGGNDWRKVEIPFQMAGSYTAGQYSIQFQVTFDEQVIEIGGFSLTDYGPNVSWRDLHLESYPYRGRKPDAAWRTAAAERMEKYRKSDIVVVVRDDEGHPVAGAPVHVKMKRHAFRFGTAVAASLINDPAQREYRNKVVELFNTVVVENALKWPQWDSDRSNALNALAWLRGNGIDRIRGHNIVWPGWRHMPDWVEGLNDDPEALRRGVREHVTDVVSATRGQLIDWDVINEPYTNHDIQNILGEDEMAEWFRLAREADPEVTLYLNDYSIINNGGYDLPHQDGYIRIANLLDSLGAPLDGLGIQGHFNNRLTDPERVFDVLDRFAALNKTLLITEFDVDTPDEQLQADYTRDFLTAVFSHPAIKGFYMWGFWAGRHWRPDSAMYHEDWTPKLNALVWNDLVFHQWWTDVEGTTDANGIFRTHGFLGDYDIDVTRDGSTETFPLSTDADRSPGRLVVGKEQAGSFTVEGMVNAEQHAAAGRASHSLRFGI